MSNDQAEDIPCMAQELELQARQLEEQHLVQMHDRYAYHSITCGKSAQQTPTATELACTFLSTGAMRSPFYVCQASHQSLCTSPARLDPLLSPLRHTPQ